MKTLNPGWVTVSRPLSWFSMALLWGILTFAPQSLKAESESEEEVDVSSESSGEGGYFAFGDSMTAGFLADYTSAPRNIGDMKTLRFISGLLALPFRIMQAHGWFSDLLIPLENRAKSWATGKRYMGVNGFYHHISNKINKIYNYAVSGANARDLQKQWKRAKNKKAWKNAYVTVLIGANDLCENDLEKMATGESYLADVKKLIEPMLERGAKVMLVMPPNVTKLKAAMENHRQPILGWNKLLGSRSCKSVWKSLPNCPNVTNSDKAHAFIEKRGLEYRDALMSINHPNVVVADQTWYQDFTPEDVSIDCFHPSTRGQRRLADTIAQAIPDFWLR